MKDILLLSSLIAVLAFSSCHERSNDTARNKKSADLIDTIAFGSCSNQDLPQPLWDDIRADHPDLWIWLGDNIYGDSYVMDTLRKKYERAKNNPGYAALRSECRVIGVWDDHDYGLNDGGKEYPMKDSSKVLLLDFLDIPGNAEVRQHKGAYQAYTFGEDGHKVKVILLDTRYFRDSLTPSTKPGRRYEKNETGDMLGEEQWKWLEKELEENDAEVTLLGSSIQVLHEEHGWEKWNNLPKARQRLFDLIRKYKPRNLLILSGDRHIAEMAKMDLEGYGPLYEITSSGLTHTWSSGKSEANKYRVDDNLIIHKNYGLLLIDWNTDEATLRVQIKGDKGVVYGSWDLKDL